MSNRNNTSTSPQSPRNRRLLRLPNFGLSATQLVATALAAVTATFAASYFGVAGTVIGAALVSVVTAAGKEVYSQSLRSTGHRVLAVVPVTRSLPVSTGDPSGPPTDPADTPPSLPAATPVLGVRRWQRVAIGTTAVFVAVLAVITGVEIVAGRPVSDLVRGESGAGTSFFGNAQVRTKTVPPTAPPAPTVTMTVTPKVVITTPTVTQTAPAKTATRSASGTPSAPTTTPATTGAGASTTGTPSRGATTSRPAG